VILIVVTEHCVNSKIQQKMSTVVTRTVLCLVNVRHVVND